MNLSLRYCIGRGRPATPHLDGPLTCERRAMNGERMPRGHSLAARWPLVLMVGLVGCSGDDGATGSGGSDGGARDVVAPVDGLADVGTTTAVCDASITPLAKDELTGPRGEGHRRMIELCPVGRAGTPDEVGTVGALLMGADGAFITGSDFLMDGGVTASYWFGELALK